MASSPKRSRISTNDNFILPDDILVKIIHGVPLAQWPMLELVSKQFLRSVKIAYRALTSLNLKSIVLPEFGKYSRKRGHLKECLTKLVRSCPQLQTISEFYCLTDSISSAHFDLLRKLTKLKNVSFDNCRINISVLSRFLKKFPLMKSLKINNCKLWHDSFRPITDDDQITKNPTFFDFFETFSGLFELTINGTFGSFSGDFLSLVNTDNLKLLNFSESKFDGPYVVAFLNRCVNLETLYLYDPTTRAVDDIVGLELEVLQCLPNLPKLREFHLRFYCPCEQDNNVQYTAENLLNVLVRCNSLREFSLFNSDSSFVTEHFLQGLITACPLLEKLHLDAVFTASRETVSKIADLHCLSSLSILHWEDRCDVLKALCSKLHKLKKLSSLRIYAPCIKIPEQLMLKVSDSLTSFTYVGTYLLTKRAVQTWIEAGFLKKLKILKLFVKVTNSIVESIAENAPVLETLQLHVGSISDETLLSIAENCKRLEILNLENCLGMSENGLLVFLSLCSGLKWLFVHSDFNESIQNNELFQPYKRVVRLDFGGR